MLTLRGGLIASLHIESSQGPLTKSGISMSWNP
jgi:lipoprotein-releasing system permease protein